MNIAITGASGFIGRHLTAFLGVVQPGKYICANSEKEEIDFAIY